MDFFKEWLAKIGIDSRVSAMDSSKLGDVILRGEYDAFEWDWFVEPDPDGILADFTCAQRGGLSDSWYCDKSYDAMYQQQNTETDDAKRVALVKQMQRKLYADSPYIVTAYTTTGEAVRSDRFACFQPQPDPGGVWLVQYGAHNYSQLRPADKAGNCDGVKSALGATVSASGSGSGGGSSVATLVGGVQTRSHDRDTGGVVAAIFEALQCLDELSRNGTFSQNPNNSAHISASRSTLLQMRRHGETEAQAYGNES